MNSLTHKVTVAQDAKQNQLASDYVAIVKKEVEPLLKNAKPYFGGSEKFTLAEVGTEQQF